MRLVFGRLVFVLINRFAKTFSHNDVIGEYLFHTKNNGCLVGKP